jgi:hypothetical protein
MGIAVKNSGIKLDNTIKRGNLALGINNIEYGPSQTTGYYSGMSIPTNGYVLYETNSGGRLRMYRAQNDAEFINIVNKLGGNADTIDEALAFVTSNTNFLPLDKPISNISTDGLVLYYDANLISSYPKNGTTIYDLSGKGNNGVLINGVGFTDSGVARFQLDGTNDRIDVPKDLNGFEHNIQYDINWTIECYMYMYPHDGLPQHYIGIYGNYNGCNYTALKGNAQGILIYNANNSATTSVNFSFGPLNNPSGSQCPNVSINWSTAESGWVAANVNKWCHFVMTSDDGTTYKIYVNGIQQGATKTVDFKNSQLRIDNNLTATYNYSWGGNNSTAFNEVNFSNMKIYNRPLTEYEIYQNYITTLDPNIVTDGKSLIQDWSNLGSLTARTSNALIAPDGTRSATLFERISINLTGHAQIRQALPVVDLLPSTSYDVSFWAKRVNLTQKLDFDFSDTPLQVITLTDDWKFYSFSLTTNATFPVGEFIDIGSTTTAAGSVLNEQYSIWNLHVSISKT